MCIRDRVYGWGGYGVFKSTDAGITWSISNSGMGNQVVTEAVSYTHLRAHETVLDLVCRLLLEKKKKNKL